MLRKSSFLKVFKLNVKNPKLYNKKLLNDTNKPENQKNINKLKENFDKTNAHNYRGNVEEISKEIFERIKQIDDFSKYKGYSIFRIFISTTFIFIILILIFRKDLKQFLQDHGYEVFNNTLSNDEVLKTATELSKYIVSEILIDAEILAVALLFLNSLTEDESNSFIKSKLFFS